MTALQSFCTSLRVLRRTPAIAAFAVVFGVLGGVSQASQLTGTIGTLLQFLLAPALVGALYTVIDGARPRSSRDLGVVRAAQRYYVSLLGAAFLLGILTVFLGVVLMGSAFGYVGFERGNAILNGTASLTTTEFAVVGAASVAFFVLLFLFRFYDTAIVFDGRTAGGSISRSINFVLGNLRSVLGYAVVATAVTGVIDLPVMWVVVFDSATSVGAAITASQSALGPGEIAIVAVAATITSLIARTYKVCFYRACTEPDVGGREQSMPAE
ncbi:hypothetical protein C455_15408 [Haloferax larsenii JCM 13917]|nr:hypothetical protein [Haloferax larsenii]ELZ76025.1 hypothetical protein C455_15408 [Haloferax larsenii JCM 13917]